MTWQHASPRLGAPATLGTPTKGPITAVRPRQQLTQIREACKGDVRHDPRGARYKVQENATVKIPPGGIIPTFPTIVTKPQ